MPPTTILIASGRLDSAIRDLAGLGADAVGPIIQTVTSSSDERLQTFLLIALGSVNERHSIGQLQTEALSGLLTRKPPFPVRYWIMKNLATIPLPAAVEPLEQALAGDDALIAGVALQALVDRKQKASADKIVPLLEHGDTQLRIQAAMALMILGNETHVDSLIKLLSDSDRAVQFAAVMAIECFAQPSFGLTPQDTDEQVQKKIADWLAQRGKVTPP